MVFQSCSDNIKKDMPILSFAADTLKFVNLKTNDSLLLEYKFKNLGEANLKILDVGVECGCTKPSYDTINYTPKSNGVIRLKFLSTGDTGKVIKTVVVKANTNPALKVLYLTGNVIQ